MKENRIKLVEEVLQKVVSLSSSMREHTTKKNKTGEVYAFIINGLEWHKQKLESLGFVVISPCPLNDMAMEQMKMETEKPENHFFYRYPSIVRDNYKKAMIIDSAEEKSEALANEIIQYYYSSKDWYKSFLERLKIIKNGVNIEEYDNFNKESNQTLGNILSKIGFTTEFDNKNNLVVRGNNFEIKVNGKNGEEIKSKPSKIMSSIQKIYRAHVERLRFSKEQKLNEKNNTKGELTVEVPPVVRRSDINQRVKEGVSPKLNENALNKMIPDEVLEAFGLKNPPTEKEPDEHNK